MFKNLLLLTVVGLLTLMLAEGALRVAGVSYPIFSDYDDSRGFKLRPGKSGYYEGEGAATISINSLGYRDLERTVDKPSDTVRIAVLGDSFVEARQVELKDTFVSLLDSQLDACERFEGKNVEVMNFGVGGYNTTQALLTLEQDALRFDPDHVVLGVFAGNDIHTNSFKTIGSRGWKARAPTHEIINGELIMREAAKPPLHSLILYEGTHRLKLLELINQVRRRLAEREKNQQQQKSKELVTDKQGADVALGISRWIYSEPKNENNREAWDITQRILSIMADRSQQADAHFLVAVIPLAEQVNPDTEKRDRFMNYLGVDNLFYPEARLTEFGREDGYDVLALAPVMADSAIANQSYYHGFPNTALGRGHLNESGHIEVARHLYNALCSTDGHS